MSMSTDEVEREFAKLRTADEDLSKHTDTASGEIEEEELDETITADEARTLKEDGNKLYKSGNYTQAAEKYSRASRSAKSSSEERAVYLANLAAADLKLTRYKEVVTAATSALKLKPGYTKVLARRKEAHERLEDWSSALDDAKALGSNEAELRHLRLKAEEKQKRDAKEAMDSLKGLGNSILSNFGMSLDDFSFEKDENSGSYNIKMKK